MKSTPNSTPEQDRYWTLAQAGEGIFKAKGSKHLGFVYPLHSLEEIQHHLQALRKLHFAATHHCYAYRLGPTGEVWRAQDDGEPSNSAGMPILGALRSCEVTDCLAVVVRYYGGTKLGVSGLIEAYREATWEALNSTQRLEKWVESELLVDFPCDMLGEVMRVLKWHGATPDAPVFDGKCSVAIRVRRNQAAGLIQALETLAGVSSQILRTR